MLKTIATFLLISLTVACNNNDNNTPSRTAANIEEDNTIVYIMKGSTQCHDDGIKPEESTQTLINAGIDVIQSYCGHLTGIVYLSVCGGGTGEIIAHEIRTVNLPHAIEQGYEEIDTLIDEETMTGYEIDKCENI